MAKRLLPFLLLLSVEIIKVSADRQNLTCDKVELSFQPLHCGIRNTVIIDINNVDFVDLKSTMTRVTFRWGLVTMIPPNFFVKYPQVTLFSMMDTKMSKFGNEDLEGGGNLETLSLSNFAFTELKPQSFLNAPKLKQFTLFQGELSSIDANVFKGLKMLNHLSLTELKIESLPSGIFDELHDLQDLKIQKNFLSALPVDLFKRNPNLTRVDFSDNQIKNVPLNIFANNLNVDYASFRNNLLEKSSTFRVYSIDLTDNKLKTIFITKKTRNVLLANNKIDRVNCATDLSIIGFHAFNNSISNFRCIRNMKNITNINLSFNNLTIVGKPAFKNLVNLKEVNLIGNKLKFLWPRIFIPATKIETIYAEFFNNYRNLKLMLPKIWRVELKTKFWNCTYFDEVMGILKNQKIYTISNGCTI